MNSHKISDTQIQSIGKRLQTLTPDKLELEIATMLKEPKVR